MDDVVFIAMLGKEHPKESQDPQQDTAQTTAAPGVGLGTQEGLITLGLCMKHPWAH